ncbi:MULTISPECIES: nucleotide sugar dehydrogenase [Brevibacillus]|uniref:Nucleotide sugar dehydrogenase n=1 Tax=Brevibacillus thermoruber TaxID=33942 RepID=A0A9X3TLM1_9BACL|nr:MULTISPECIES: nucleotide sugar dehydrogenase [Brevibacillus]MDA5106747.1 nucleotide sugar dehydrogenase [Brevibacillus thermoruber]TRY28253.1 nucleotide sugar dehydrogenase [Brevibacillus sp. LEMMJ03]
MDRFTALQQKIENKTAKVGVIGLGYVGLPLAVEIARHGFTVFGIDLDLKKIETLQRGESYIRDVPAESVRPLVEEGRLIATADYRVLKELDAISICVPTPLSENQDPDTSYISRVVDQIKHYVQNGPLITLESTTYPGTTEELIQWELEKMGYRVGTDFFLCFSPERVDPGNSRFQTTNTPKVIGGTTEKCLALGVQLYSNFIEHIVPVSSTKVAEMSKLLENTFRSVNIAFINEMALMCERMGIDVWEVIKASSTKPFGFMPFYPGPGIGGHCIPLDPMYLSWKAKGYRFFSKFIDLAQSINNGMPDYVVYKASIILNRYAKSLRNSRVLLLGMAYKPDIDDLRESPGLQVYELFKDAGALVDYYDPHAHTFKDKHGREVKSVEYDIREWKKYDIMVLITNHSAFNYRELADLGVAILDTRNAFDGIHAPHLYKLGTSIAPVEAKEPSMAI